MASKRKIPDILNAHCPTCDGERSCEKYGEVTTTWDWEDKLGGHYMNGGAHHYLLQCAGCKTVFYQIEKWNSEDYTNYYDANGETQIEYDIERQTFPAPEKKTKPLWLDAITKIDRQLEEILHEVYVAFENQSYILTAVGLRTVFDRSTELLGIDPAISFEDKLDELESGGWIGSTERDILGVITDAGSAAAHRGWSPSEGDAQKLLTAMEAFIHRAFIVGQDALSIKASIPPKPKRKKKP